MPSTGLLNGARRGSGASIDMAPNGTTIGTIRRHDQFPHRIAWVHVPKCGRTPCTCMCAALRFSLLAKVRDLFW